MEKDGKGYKKQEIATKTEKYERPEQNTEPNWEFPELEIGIESLPEFLMALWHMAGETYDEDDNESQSQDQPWYSRWFGGQSRQTSPDQEPQSYLPMHKPQPPGDQEIRGWCDDILRIRIYIPMSNWNFPLSNWLASFRSDQSAAGSDFYTTSNPERAVQNVGIEIELALNNHHVFNEVPKRIRERLFTDPTCHKPVAGWGLWVEEEFIIPWYTLVLLNLLPFVTLLVGIFESSKHGVTWLALSAYGVTLSAFIFAQWVAKTKDSKG
jgi:hypothetical protein